MNMPDYNTMTSCLITQFCVYCHLPFSPDSEWKSKDCYTYEHTSALINHDRYQSVMYLFGLAVFVDFEELNACISVVIAITHTLV